MPTTTVDKGSVRGNLLHEEARIEWPEPESLTWKLSPVPAMDEDLLPAALRPWLADICDRMQCPLEYAAVGAIVGLSSAIGRRCAIRPKRKDNWTVIPNLWGFAIGRPGTKKTPPMAETLSPLTSLQNEALKRYRKEMELYNSREDRKEPPPEPPVRYTVTDTTMEKLGEILVRAPSGILVYRDELPGWFRNLSKEGHESARAFYLETWNGDGSYTFDRIRRGTVHIEAACISIVGTAQPDTLAEYFSDTMGGSAGADGLMQRFQVVLCPDISPELKIVDRYPDMKAAQRGEHIYHRLLELESMPSSIAHLKRGKHGIPYLRFEDEAQERFFEWYEANERRVRDTSEHPAISGHLSKYGSLVPSLALQFHLVEWAGRPGESRVGPVTLEAIERAIRWCEFLEPHARRVYGMAAQTSDSTALHILAEKLHDGKLKPGFTPRDVYRNCWAGLQDKETVNRVLEELVQLGWLVRIKSKGRGHPRLSHFVNPAINGLRR